ncbi:hypothetical protein C0J52_09662 [Blattella germanica]|nr:hypothetical protein C0J52_09662 [Blattella germanica]
MWWGQGADPGEEPPPPPPPPIEEGNLKDQFQQQRDQIEELKELVKKNEEKQVSREKEVEDFKNVTRKTFKTGSNVMLMILDQVLTDDEIIASVIDDQDLCDEEEEPSDEDCAEKGPSSEEAFHCLETAMKWVEQQEECDAVQLLCLKRLRDLAAKKRKYASRLSDIKSRSKAAKRKATSTPKQEAQEQETETPKMEETFEEASTPRKSSSAKKTQGNLVLLRKKLEENR